MRTQAFLSIVLYILILQYSVEAQDSVEVTILCPQIGPFIELSERNYYRIFSTDVNFQLAYILRDSDKVYSARIIFGDETGSKERKVDLKEVSLFNIAERLTNFEKIKTGEYTVGENPARLSYVWVKKEEINKKIKKEQKLQSNFMLTNNTGNDYEKFFFHYPRFGISLGPSFTDFNFDEIASLTNEVDKYFNERGYAVSPQKDFDYKLGSVFRIKGLFEITAEMSAALMIEYNLSNSKIEYQAMTLMAMYRFTSLIDNFAPYAGLGYTRNNFLVTIDYGKASVDSLGGMLESVTVDGETAGLITEAGIIASLGNTFCHRNRC